LKKNLHSTDKVRGRELFSRVFGPDYGARLAEQLSDGQFNLTLMCRIAPEVWSTPSPALNTKILIALAVCATANQDISYFVRAAIYHGISRGEVEGALLLAGLEGGFPAAAAARRLIEPAYRAHAAMLEELGRPAMSW